jgi:endonuclease/exonuclease/phosphatase family metal-dependent hydrolase
LLLVACSLLLAGCPQKPKPKPDRTEPRRRPPRGAPSVIAPATDTTVLLRARNWRGVPLHPRAKSRAVSGRIPDGTRVKIVAERYGGRWLKVRAPDGTTGWIVRRYVVWKRSSRRRGPRRWRPPPATGVTCPAPAPGSNPTVTATDVTRPVVAGSGRTTPLPAKLTVASYNVWELYDGYGGDKYYSRYHADSLTPTDVKLRVAKLAAALRPAKPHVIAFQEIEDAKLACRVAAKVDAQARWRCGAGRWTRRGRPQNIAIASRVGGKLRVLTPAGRFAPRGAVELELPKAKLRVLSIHLKSSRGARGYRDCRNATRRRDLARALVSHLRASRTKHAALVVGDYNFEPATALHDQTDDVLIKARLKNLTKRFYPNGAPATYPHFKSTIDLAFFRAASTVRATGFRVLTKARTDRWTSDHRPVVVTLKLR